MNATPVPSGATPTAEHDAFIAAVAQQLTSFLAEKHELLAQISPDTLTLIESIKTLVTGGKRMRALLCYWGWRGAGGAADAEAVVQAGAALELFQAAALIHDDIIDRSDTRRGGPSVHRQFSTLHSQSSWALDDERFGHAAAILTGDLCLSLSEEMFSRVGSGSAGSLSPAAAARARAVFNVMRTEVMAGQYLDILEEVSGPSKPHGTAVARASAIIRYKSAKYSSEHPLVLGGALAGADENLLAGYSAFALPLGEAFQLRDDVLGVFGDPATTGKPAGDDLREGKRTVLVGLTIDAANEADATFVDANLGRQDLSDEEIARLCAIMVDSGALARTEAMISELGERAFSGLARLNLADSVAAALSTLGHAAVSRTS
ncbi:geranylgeranyl diphosphate synthase, type I [Arthrobacter alpinus]|uniref:Geranylgeranyl diphosphate synthase, type I n=1 Tax=Arthrobacter alpinus TaxID=656366 RepID=A0A1H5GKP7_9MICC|nr:polyprenyl synthetase family protein [Arthrobacter alpinus]SEE16210.1 geranylgeranyl diphosphate synthase, type I [Arthrobacter alpinus]